MTSILKPKAKIAVLGAGQMGSGIATLLADAGHAVALWDLFPAVATGVAEAYGSNSNKAGNGSVTAHDELESTVSSADVVLEAIAEDLDAKQRVFTAVSRSAPATAIITSNTSSLPAAQLVPYVTNPGRFAIAHFFNPPRIVPLVELVPVENASGTTHPLVLDTLFDILASAGKTPVILKSAVPGFVANRLQAALLREAFALVEDGVASFQDIDTVVRAGLGARWAAAGPMMVTDLGGLDIWQAVTTQLFPSLCSAATPPKAITERVARGELGAKTGSGLYVHNKEEDDEARARISAHFELDRE
jgi:3-hydroxybutyryl-CoA dehydrogenase